LRDNPANPAWREGDDPYRALLPQYTSDRPELQDVIRRFRSAVGDERLLIGELYLPIERLMAYYASGLDMPANFHLLTTPWTAHDVADLVERYEAALPEGAWPNWVLGNHDRPRVATRLGVERARVAAMLLLTLRGTPTLYYGDELGMTDVEIPPERVQDPWQEAGRDPARTPMRWSTGGGFTTGEPWLPMGDPAVNVETQEDDPGSMLNLHRALIALRREFVDQPYATIAADDRVLVFARGDRFVVALNLSSEPAELPRGRVRLSTHGEPAGVLRPGEGVVLSR
jgi:alpha-glucosidase